MQQMWEVILSLRVGSLKRWVVGCMLFRCLLGPSWCLDQQRVEKSERHQGLAACPSISTGVRNHPFLKAGTTASYVGCIPIALQGCHRLKVCMFSASGCGKRWASAWFLRYHSLVPIALIGWGHDGLHHRDVSARAAALAAFSDRGVSARSKV